MRKLAALACLLLVLGIAWLSGSGRYTPVSRANWIEIIPGVLRSAGLPAGYALLSGERALLIDAPAGMAGLGARRIRKIDGVLLTHHHRDTCAAVEQLLREGIPVRAPKESAAWLTPKNVENYWKESLPLRNSRTAYLVVPVGFASSPPQPPLPKGGQGGYSEGGAWEVRGIDCSLQDAQTIDWQGWNIRVLRTPGHSPDHVAFVVYSGQGGKRLLFCGDAFAAPGRIWTPYTTDWDHWTDAGLRPAAQSLRKLAAENADLLLPAHGRVVETGVQEALKKTEAAVSEMAFLKSFERFTKQRLGNAPHYRFLAREQAESNGSKPWTQVSEHLFLTGNTYVLKSRDNALLIVDPWGEQSARQIAKLQRDRSLGPVEVVWFSHAHYDHYDGIYYLPGREKFETWTLDKVATPITEPYLLRAPFLDARPVKIDRRFPEGATASWHEYRFRFHYLPGQSEFTMGVETVIDGKRCLFTADNWFHQDMFSGSGGWMGLNRSWPGYYEASARKVLELAPEWVLAEHGGPFEFNAEDFRRRVEWGKVSARAADALCVSGNHRLDWDPHRVHVEPLVHPAKAGEAWKATLVASNLLDRPVRLSVTLQGRELTPDQLWELDLAARSTVRKEIRLPMIANLAPGRHVLTLRVNEGNGVDGSDAFLAIDVATP
jgi:glyoxylase-like metal-dependent hydrolase (beta-lactamase superfamily II)